MKQATILTSVFKKEFLSKTAGRTLYYYTITLSNGETGDVAVTEMNSSRICVGNVINYDKNEKSIKIPSDGIVFQAQPNIQQEANFEEQKPQAGATSTQAQSAPAKPNYSGKNQTDFLAQTMSYGKDIVVALINSGDKNALKEPTKITIEIADVLLDSINKHLKGEK